MHKREKKGLSLLQEWAIFREVEMINAFKRGTDSALLLPTAASKSCYSITLVKKHKADEQAI